MANLLDWKVLSNNTSVKQVIPNNDSHTYDLYNPTVAEALKYMVRTWGINLGWTDPDASDNIRFQRQSGSKEPIKFEEPIAINIRGGKWLVYHVRDKGINLGWSDTPKFEWIFKGGNAGNEVNTDTIVGLYNTVENDTVMYEPRTWGINLKWFKDSGKHNELGRLIELGKEIKEWWPF